MSIACGERPVSAAMPHSFLPSPLAGEGGAKRRMRGTGACVRRSTLTRRFGAPSPVKGEGGTVIGGRP